MLKGIVDQKWKVVPKLCEFLSFVEHKRVDILKNIVNQTVAGHHWLP